jgi:hypothetical protein
MHQQNVTDLKEKRVKTFTAKNLGWSLTAIVSQAAKQDWPCWPRRVRFGEWGRMREPPGDNPIIGMDPTTGKTIRSAMVFQRS